MRMAPLFRDNRWLVIRATLALLLMLGAYVAFTAVLALGFGLSVGPLVLLVIIGAAMHLLGSRGRVWRDLGIDQQEPPPGSVRVIASDVIRWALPPAFPMMVWLLWIRVPTLLPLLLGLAVVIFLLEVVVFWWRSSTNDIMGGAAGLTLSRIVEGTPLDALQRVSQLAGQPAPALFLLEGRAPDAFAVGLSPSAGQVVITKGLVDLSLSGEEMEAVMAHELCHLIHHDPSVLLAVEGLGAWPGFVGSALVVIATIVGWLSVCFLILARMPGMAARGFLIVGVMLLLAAIGRGAWLLGRLVTLALTRYREFAADSGSALITGDPSQLAGALAKISQALDHSAPADLRRLGAANALMLCEANRTRRARRLRKRPDHKVVSRSVTAMVALLATACMDFKESVLLHVLAQTRGLTSGHPSVSSRIASLQAMIVAKDQS